jgi:predicted transcriptional regulator
MNRMTTVKQEALRTLENLPEDATWDDILYTMYVRHAVAEGEADIAAGRTFSTEEVLRSLGLPAK